MPFFKTDFQKSSLLFLLLLCLFLFIDKNQLHNLIYEKKIFSIGFVQTGLYFFTYLGLVLSALIFILAKNKVIKSAFLSLLFITLSISLANKIAHNGDFGVNEASTVLNELQWAGEAIHSYYSQYIISILLSLLIVCTLIIITK